MVFFASSLVLKISNIYRIQSLISFGDKIHLGINSLEIVTGLALATSLIHPSQNFTIPLSSRILSLHATCMPGIKLVCNF